jgi:hypothetical protein
MPEQKMSVTDDKCCIHKTILFLRIDDSHHASEQDLAIVTDRLKLTEMQDLHCM